MSFRNLILTVIFAWFLSACTVGPSAIQGEFNSLTPEDAPVLPKDSSVRWAGTILQTQPAQDETCVEVLGKAQFSSGRPKPSDSTTGRFLACSVGFLDPAIYDKGRSITVIGDYIKTIEKTIGDYDYPLPVIYTSHFHLWPIQQKTQTSIHFDTWPYYPRHYPIIIRRAPPPPAEK